MSIRNRFQAAFGLVMLLAVSYGVLAVQRGQAPAQGPPPAMRSIAAAKRPLPSEDMSANVTKFSFIVYGDTRGRRDGVELQYEHSLVADSMVATIKRLDNTDYPVRWVMQTGDAVVNGGDSRQWNSSFVDIINRLTVDAGVPYYLAPGNHDVTAAETLEATGRQAALKNYLTLMTEMIPANNTMRRLAEYPTYAFGYGNTFVLAIDSNVATDNTQFEWAKKQLEGLDRKRYVNVVAMFHHPIFSSGPHGASKLEPATAAMRTRYMPLFRANHVKVIFAGHDHLFEHWVERYTDAAGRQRMDLVTTAGGGAPIYTYQGEPDLTAYLRENATARVQVEHLVRPGMQTGDNPYHYLLVRVDGDRLDMDVIGVDWGVNYQPYRSNKTELRDLVR